MRNNSTRVNELSYYKYTTPMQRYQFKTRKDINKEVVDINKEPQRKIASGLAFLDINIHSFTSITSYSSLSPLCSNA